MAQTTISDLFTPAVWIPAVNERMATFPTLWNSGIVVRKPDWDAKATGAGTSVNMPFIKDATDNDDAIQVEDTAPTPNEATGDYLPAPILNRVSPFASTALAKAVSGADVDAYVTSILAEIRMKQRQKTLLSIVRGAFGTLSATTCAMTSALATMRLDKYDESGTDATAEQVMNASLFIDGCALLGELENDLIGGGIWMHPTVKAALKKADLNNWDKASQGAFQIETYRGLRVYPSASLVRAGSTNGYVYETYLLTRGIVGWGEKPQVANQVDVASLNVYQDVQKNNVEIYDRSRFLIALNGMKWAGTPGGQSATNTELATITGATANWALGASSAARVGAVCILTNG